MESCFVRMDGQEIDVEIRAVPFVFQEQPAVLAVVQDITLAKRKSRQQMARQDLYEIAAHMQGPADNDKLLMAICECLNAATIPYLFCGIYIVNKTAGQLQIKQFKYRLADSQMVQVATLGADQTTLVLRFWQAGIPLYRPDLEKENLLS